MRRKIIKPEGIELENYLNDGYAICNKCGAVMDYQVHPGDTNERYTYICPSCGWEIDTIDYEYEGELYTEEWAPEIVRSFGGEVPPEGCLACGGPYPYCTTSCKMFDD